MTAIMWFRRDLRLADNPALRAAAQADAVLPVFVVEEPARAAAPRSAGARQVPPAFVADEPAGAAASLGAGAGVPPSVLLTDEPQGAAAPRSPQAWRDASLAALHEATDGALVVRVGDPALVLAELAAQVGAGQVHAAWDLTPAGRRRDEAVERALADRQVELVRSGTAYAVAPGRLTTGKGEPYQVFTPFSRAWREFPVPPPTPRPVLRWARLPVAGDVIGALPAVNGSALGGGASGTACGVALDGRAVGGSAAKKPAAAGYAAGEAAALARWHDFLDADLATYSQERDRPDLDTTSRLSAHLAWGEVHPRTLLADLIAHPDASGPGAQQFLGELAWREFFADVLWHRPASAWSDLRPELADMQRDPAGAEVEAWRAGRTGFPLIDAGMRQLDARGWMHNRVRMVTASFLVKDLHVSWQVGAQHFLDRLVDGDLASNTGNWQWVAGTGVDAAPYFRIFNPVSQGLKFDPHGDYVRRWVPELAHLPGAAAHEPWRHPDGYAHGYPHRIVDHDEERREALDRYARARGR